MKEITFQREDLKYLSGPLTSGVRLCNESQAKMSFAGRLRGQRLYLFIDNAAPWQLRTLFDKSIFFRKISL